MATVCRPTAHAFPAMPRKAIMPSRPPIHDGPRDSYDRLSTTDNHDAYIGEGLLDPDGVDALEEVEVPKQQRRRLLDELAIDVGEKYLDSMYKEDEGGDNQIEEEDDTDDDGGFYSDGSQPDGAAMVKPTGAKSPAWQKVRQLLVVEEEKAQKRKDSNSKLDTVRLLDSLVRSGSDDLYCGSSSSSDAARAPTPTSYNARPQKHTSRLDRMGNRLAQFLNLGPGDDGAKSWHSQTSSSNYDRPNNDSFVAGSASARLALLETLTQLTLTCQRAELTEVSTARISSHLSAIDHIMREDIGGQQQRTRRLLSTQQSNQSSEYEREYRNRSHPVVDVPYGYQRANVAPTVRSAFKSFVSAQDLTDTLAAFNNLVADCGLDGVKLNEPSHVYYHIRAAVYSKLGYRQKHLFKLLDARFNVDVYKQRPAANKRVCIVGAGPVGLRAAVELALLGSEVSVLEKRTKFNRENMLHLWPWVVQDLASLGAKVLHSRFCKSRTYFHVSTRQVQVILLKVALLVGVKIHFATSFQAIIAPEEARAGSRPFYSIRTEPQIPVVEFTAVLGATGVNDQLAEPAAINRFVFSQKESLGIVCYFPNLETTEEMKVKEFSWTTQLKHQMLYKMREVGIDLENIVYFRGEMHYLVMTPKRNNLLVRGVVTKNIPSSKELVQDENVNRDALYAFVNRIVEFAGIPRKAEFTRVNLFDFSSLTRADKAASILASHSGKKLYVGLIGDSLLEPVWHEGVGTCRGFLSALDGAWLIAQIGMKTDEQLLADRDAAYKVMQRLSGHHRAEMQKNVRKYTVDPKSRYLIDFPEVAEF